MKKIKYSILDLAVVAEGNSIQKTLNNSLKVAQKAEEKNYERVWYAEHHNMEHVGSAATSLIIGYVAENTHRIRVGSGGIMLPNHSPLIIAEQFGTLGHLYPERIDLGLGRAPGTDQETAHAIRPNFIQSAQSFPSEIEKIQKYFSIQNKSAKVRAAIAEETNVPLYILGSSTDSAHLAAAKGLPYAFASHFAPPQLYQAIEIYRSEFVPSEQLSKPYVMVAANIILADTEEEAQAIFTSVIRIFVGIVTGQRKAIQAPEPMSKEYRDMFNHPSINRMMKCSFVGTKESVKQEVREFLSATQADEIITLTNVYSVEDRMRSIELFGELMEEIQQEVTVS